MSFSVCISYWIVYLIEIIMEAWKFNDNQPKQHYCVMNVFPNTQISLPVGWIINSSMGPHCVCLFNAVPNNIEPIISMPNSAWLQVPGVVRKNMNCSFSANQNWNSVMASNVIFLVSFTFADVVISRRYYVLFTCIITNLPVPCFLSYECGGRVSIERQQFSETKQPRNGL